MESITESQTSEAAPEARFEPAPPGPLGPKDSLAIFAVAALVRLVALKPGRPPTPDEAEILRTAFGEVSDGALLGTRLLLAVLGSLACLLTARFASRFQGRLGAWVAGGLLALAPYAVATSSEAGTGALLTLAGAGAIGSLATLARAGSWLAALAAGAFAGLGAAAASGGGAFLLAVPVALRGAGAWRVALRWLAAAAAALVLFLAARLISGFEQSGLQAQPHYGASGSPLLEGLARVRAMAGWLPSLLAFAGLFAAGRRRPGELTAPFFGLGLALVVTLLKTPTESHALAIVLPGVFVLAGFAVTAPALSSRLRLAGTGLVLLVSLAGTFGLVTMRWSRTPQQKAEEWIRRNLPEQAPVLIEAEGLPLASVDGLAEVRRQVASGEASAAVLESYAPGGKAFRLLELPPPRARSEEEQLQYDPDLARHFPYVVLQDGARSETETNAPSLRKEFHEHLKASWPVLARFRPGRHPTGVTVYARPKEFAPDEQRLQRIRTQLAEFTAVRDTSRAFGEWLTEGGGILRSVGALSAAKEFLLPAADRDSSSVEAQYQLGLVYLIEEQDEKAKERFLLAMFHDPEHGGVHYNLATLLEKSGDFAGAETEYRAAILLLEDPTPAHARLGALLAHVGDVEGAAAELDRLRQIDPGGEAERFLSEFLGAP